MNARVDLILAHDLIDEIHAARATIARGVEAKIARLSAGSAATPAAPRALDIFSGCGGLFLGFHRRGFASVAGVDIDLAAAASFALNFHAGEGAHHADPVDVTQAEGTPAQVLEQRGVRDVLRAVDVILGGPPCPAFTRVGRAKLRDVRGDDEAFLNDPRATLYVPYLRYVMALAPVALVMENVPDILNFGGINVGQRIAVLLEQLGYRVRYTLLNAAHYGVPQMRERFFLTAIHESVGAEPRFPAPTHSVQLPPGYASARRISLRLTAGRGDAAHFAPTPVVDRDLPPAITAQEAIGDLPPLDAHLKGLDRRGTRKLHEPRAYRSKAANAYQRAMREWPGFETHDAVTAHVTRCLTDRDYRVFREMRAGDDYPRAHAIAEHLFAHALSAARRRAHVPERSAAWKALWRAYVPPYAVEKFPNKWRKMEPDAPARTLMAHLGKDTYSHIHYESSQARTISVREAARLQSFPDGFSFAGSMNAAFRQIGNSVPPLLAYAIACSVVDALGIDLPHIPVAT